MKAKLTETEQTWYQKPFKRILNNWKGCCLKSTNENILKLFKQPTAKRSCLSRAFRSTERRKLTEIPGLLNRSLDDFAAIFQEMRQTIKIRR